MHECGYDVVVGGAVGELLWLSAIGPVHDERHGNLPLREVAVVSPEVLVVFVELLCVVASDDHDGVAMETVLL